MARDRIDYMGVALFLEEHFEEFCEKWCDGDEEVATEQIEALKEKANDD